VFHLCGKLLEQIQKIWHYERRIQPNNG
jgi:hypothetical protein